MKKPYTFNLDENTIKKLKEKSEKTGIMQSVLIDSAIRKAMKNKISENKENKKTLTIKLYDKEAEFLKAAKNSSKFLNEILKEELQ